MRFTGGCTSWGYRISEEHSEPNPPAPFPGGKGEFFPPYGLSEDVLSRHKRPDLKIGANSSSRLKTTGIGFQLVSRSGCA